MKTLTLYLAVLMLSVNACTKFKSDPPKSPLSTFTIQKNKKEILAYVDSINILLPKMKQQRSFIFSLGNGSFYVTKYQNNNDILYVEHTRRGEYGYAEQRYYFKDGNPMMYIESSNNPLTFKRGFLINGALFYAEGKQIQSKEKLNAEKFTRINNLTLDYAQEVSKFEDAIYQRGRFDLIFLGITEYPKAKYLILSRNEINAYRAPILVTHEDDFIRDITTNPEQYRGRKLKINWKLLKNNEAVYVSGGIK